MMMQLSTGEDCLGDYGIAQRSADNAVMSNSSPIIIAKRLTGLTGEALADQLGISPPHLSRLKNGKTPISQKYIQQLAKICGVTEQEFYGLMADQAGSAHEEASRKVTGVSSTERTRFDTDIMSIAIGEARRIDKEYVNGLSDYKNHSKLLEAIYTFIESEAQAGRFGGFSEGISGKRAGPRPKKDS